jgi:hypothetical protein
VVLRDKAPTNEDLARQGLVKHNLLQPDSAKIVGETSLYRNSLSPPPLCCILLLFQYVVCRQVRLHCRDFPHHPEVRCVSSSSHMVVRRCAHVIVFVHIMTVMRDATRSIGASSVLALLISHGQTPNRDRQRQ